jgi:hypothetical protein
LGYGGWYLSLYVKAPKSHGATAVAADTATSDDYYGFTTPSKLYEGLFGPIPVPVGS